MRLAIFGISFIGAINNPVSNYCQTPSEFFAPLTYTQSSSHISSISTCHVRFYSNG